MNVDFYDETNSVPTSQIDRLKQLLEFAGKHEQVADDVEMSVNFVTDEEIRRLNLEYREMDEPTDVLSFAMQEQTEGEMEIIEEHIPTLLGDIVISIDKAKEQAQEYGHSLEREIAFLTIHGFLHLLGYDHQTEEDEKEMFFKQEKILSEFGIER